MLQQTQIALGPVETPKAIKWLLAVMTAGTIGTALSDAILPRAFGFTGAYSWLSLSMSGLTNGFVWQPLSYLFILPDSQGISIGFLLLLLLNLYIVWVMGTAVMERFGSRSMLTFFLASGAAAGVLGIGVGWLTGQPTTLASPIASIYALLVAWTVLNPDVDLLLFFILPMKARWLIAGWIAAASLIALSQLDWVSLTLTLSGAALGYLYMRISWPQQTVVSRSKIFDLKTGKPIISDDIFVDEMLAKISQHGEQSLSWNERRRLRKISEEKLKNLSNR